MCCWSSSSIGYIIYYDVRLTRAIVNEFTE